MADDISLRNIDPSPVDDSDWDKASFPLSKNDPTSASTSGAVSPRSPPHNNRHALGLSAHSPLWYLLQVQKYSTYAFSAFAAAHAANTALIPLITQSVPASERFLLLTRPYYQTLPFEPLLVFAPLGAHVASGLAIRVYRRHLAAQRYGEGAGLFDKAFWPKISGTSILGYSLIPLLAGHVYLNRFLPASFPGGSSSINLSYVAHAFARHPVVSYIGFVGLIGVGVAHGVWGWARWMNWTPSQATSSDGSGESRALVKKRRWYILNAVTVALAGIWIAGGVSVVGRGGAAAGWVGRQYDEMLRCVPIVGRWLS